MVNSNAQLYVVGSIVIAAMIISGVAYVGNPTESGTQIGAILGFASLTIIQVLNYQKTAEARHAVAAVATKVAEAKEVGDANTQEIKAATLDSKVVSIQNAQALSTIETMLNGEKHVMRDELKQQRAEIGTLKITLDRVLTQLGHKQDEIDLQSKTIDLQAAQIATPTDPPA